MKKILLFVILALGACMTASAQDAQRRFNQGIDLILNFSDFIEKNKIREQYNNETGITSYLTEDRIEALLVGKEILIEVSRTSISVNTIYGDSRFINRNNYGSYIVASGLHYGEAPVIKVIVENNKENTIIRFYKGNETVIVTYWVHQYHEKSLNRRFGGVNHRSTYKPRRLF